MSDNSAIRRQISGFPTGSNKLAGKEFRVIHRKPAKPGIDLLEGFTLFTAAKAPFQELEEAVNRWFSIEEFRKAASGSVSRTPDNYRTASESMADALIQQSPLLRQLKREGL